MGVGVEAPSGSSEVLFDIRNQTLTMSGRVRQLSPKAFAVLEYLCRHPGQLLTKDELIAAVWPDVYVVEGVLKNAIQEIRKSLDDSARRPRFVETVHRRGYRFIGMGLVKVDVVEHASSVSPSPAEQDDGSVFVGRTQALQVLSQAWRTASLGTCQGVAITGDPGIGKSCLVAHWLEGLEPLQGNAVVVKVRCVPSSGQPAYTVMTDVLGELCRSVGARFGANLLAKISPNWFARMPSLDSCSYTADHRGATPPREWSAVYSEAASFVEAFTGARPAIVVLEDLQWCDRETVDLLSYMCTRQARCRLLLIATHCLWSAGVEAGAAEVMGTGERVTDAWQYLELGLLDVASVERFLQLSGVPMSSAPSVAQRVHQRCAGHPLFLSGLIGSDTNFSSSERVSAEVPDSFNRRMEQAFCSSRPEERKLLQAASVVVTESFSAAAISNLLDVELVDAEQRLDELANRRNWLARHEGWQWPDGTIAQAYGFRSTVYRDFIYAQLPLATRRQLHLLHARRLELAYGEYVDTIAVNLAYHFRQGGDTLRAAHYWDLAQRWSAFRDRAAPSHLVPRRHQVRAELKAMRVSSVESKTHCKNGGPVSVTTTKQPCALAVRYDSRARE